MRQEAAAIKAAIINLSKASGPDRALDAEIASILGWTLQISEEYDPNTREKHITQLWHNPHGEVDKVPKYTWNLDIAMSIVEHYLPTLEGGFGWEPDQGSAKFGANKPLAARTPILAICMQGLMIRLKQVDK